MRNKELGNIDIENAVILWRNFSGKESKYNREGNRNFGVLIDNPEIAQQMIDDGWNVKILQPRDENDTAKNFLNVSLSYDYYPPNIFLITRNKKTLLNSETISILDYADIKSVDMTIRPYTWEVNGKIGIKAYVKTMYVTIEEDSFAEKYAEN